MTFIAPVNAIHYNGAKPVFMDNDECYTIDINKTIDFLNKETRTVPDPIFKMFEHRQPWVEQLFYTTDALNDA